MIKKSRFIFFLIIISFAAKAQVPDSIYHERLFYLCKAWGHVKYYHTETANGNVNWDNELLAILNDVKTVPDNAAFNTTLLNMLDVVGNMGTNSASKPNIPDSLNNNLDDTWIEHPIFSASVKGKLNDIKLLFRPQDNVYIQTGSAGQPDFYNDNLYYDETDYPDESKRILALFRYWNIIHYFFPYKYIMDQYWDSTLVEFIPQIVNASSAVDYHLTFRRLTARIDDSHAFFQSPTFSEWRGQYYPAFQVRYVENETVITKVLPQTSPLKAGDIIKAIDGQDIYTLRDSLRKYSYGSNNAVIEREINNLVLAGQSGDFSITIDDGTQLQTLTLQRNQTSQFIQSTEPIWQEVSVGDSCSFGIVDMGRLTVSNVDNMFEDLWKTNAIILDIRNYPNGTLWTMVDYLFLSPIIIAKFTVPDRAYPGRLSWITVRIGNGSAETYQGNIIILFDERTQSQAEYTCMGLEQFPNAIKIGSTTAAADGNISSIDLPGNIITYATFLGTYYPDYTPTQRIGIIPDFEVKPTISGIRAGRDEVLEFALNCDFGKKNLTTVTNDIIVFPNPATDYINFQSVVGTVAYIEIFNLKGQKLKQIAINAETGQVDISDLEEHVLAVKFYTAFLDEPVTKLVYKQ